MYVAKVIGSLGRSKLMASLSWRTVSSKIMEVCSDNCKNKVNKGDNNNENKTDPYIEIRESKRKTESKAKLI